MNEKQRTVWRSFLFLAIPTVLEQFMGTILQYVDTAMVGHLGADATAAVSLSSTYNWFFNSMLGAIGMGFLAYIARSLGEKNEENTRHAAAMALETALVMGAVLTVITMAVADRIPVWMGAEEKIRPVGAMYFRTVFAPMIFRSCLLILANVIRSTGDTRTPMKINLAMNLLNMVLNYLFIYALGYGAVGAGIATGLSFAAGGLAMTAAFLKNPHVSLAPKYRKPVFPILHQILSIGIPAMFTNMISCFGYIIATRLVSSMATVTFAAHSIAITAEQLFYIPAYGMQTATSTLIGNALGERDRKKERDVKVVAIGIILVIMSILGLALFAGAEFMMRLFTTESEVISIGAGLLRIVALTEPIYGASVVMTGIYVGLGRTKYPMVIEFIGRWIIRIVGAWIWIRMFGGGIREYWYCMIADNLCRAALLALGLGSGRGRKEEIHDSQR